MNEYSHVEWLLDCTPREAQLEAVSRSYYGVRVKDNRDQDPQKVQMPGYGGLPFRGFAHLLQMRLGKTPTALNEFALLHRDRGIKKHIVIAPNKYKHDWKTEAEKFGVPVPAGVLESSNREQARKFVAENKEFQLSVNYEALQYDATMDLMRAIVDHEAMLTFDESILVKNRSSIAFKKGLELAKEAGYVRILTGKPMVQGPHDFYSQLRLIGELDGTNFFAFRNTFCLMGGFMGKQIVGVKNAERLQTLVKRRGFVAKRIDWMDTFDIDYETRRITMHPEQKKAYDEFDEEMLLLVNEHEITAEQAITKALKLQQISSGFIYDEYGTVHNLVPMEKLPKFIDLKEQLENEVEGRAIIFANFKPTIDRLLEALGPDRCAVIRGSMPPGKAQEEKVRFNTDPDCRILIGQFKATKYGHTLMGDDKYPCLDTFYFENSYSLDDRSQTEERNQGAGQKGRIHVVDYVTCQADQKIVKALQRKESISEAIIGSYRRTPTVR